MSTGELVGLSGVSYAYPGPRGRHVLHDVDLRIAAGEAVAVTGRSGSGKSTLLNIIGLLTRPTQGQLRLEGVDCSRLGERRRSRLRGSLIGFVFQGFHLLPHRSIVDNVALAGLYCGIGEARRSERALRALAQVGLEDRAHSLPTELSGGEKQRVAIARALAGDARLILADEPTGNLDTISSDAVMSLLGRLSSEGRALIMVTHDLSLAERFPRVVSVADGEVSETAGALPPGRSSGPALDLVGR